MLREGRKEPLVKGGRAADHPGPKGRGPIRTWPAGERPREKLLRHGAGTLSDAELLALLIRTGSGASSALDIAWGMLRPDRTLAVLARRNALELMRVEGIGEAKALGILAAFEIGRRLQVALRRKTDAARGPRRMRQGS